MAPSQSALIRLHKGPSPTSEAEACVKRLRFYHVCRMVIFEIERRSARFADQRIVKYSSKTTRIAVMNSNQRSQLGIIPEEMISLLDSGTASGICWNS